MLEISDQTKREHRRMVRWVSSDGTMFVQGNLIAKQLSCGDVLVAEKVVTGERLLTVWYKDEYSPPPLDPWSLSAVMWVSLMSRNLVDIANSFTHLVRQLHKDKGG